MPNFQGLYDPNWYVFSYAYANGSQYGVVKFTNLPAQCAPRGVPLGPISAGDRSANADLRQPRPFSCQDWAPLSASHEIFSRR